MSDLRPEDVGLSEQTGAATYLDEYERVWIGAKWDIAAAHDGRFHVYRKGTYRTAVGTLDLACRIVADNEGFGATP